MQQYIEKAINLSKKSRQRQHYRVGQKVRVHLKKGAFLRSYHYQANLQRYIVSNVDKTYREVRYKLKDEKNRELAGYFYAHELIPIYLSDKYRAEKVGEKVVGGKKVCRNTLFGISGRVEYTGTTIKVNYQLRSRVG